MLSLELSALSHAPILSYAERGRPILQLTQNAGGGGPSMDGVYESRHHYCPVRACMRTDPHSRAQLPFQRREAPIRCGSRMGADRGSNRRNPCHGSEGSGCGADVSITASAVCVAQLAAPALRTRRIGGHGRSRTGRGRSGDTAALHERGERNASEGSESRKKRTMERSGKACCGKAC